MQCPKCKDATMAYTVFDEYTKWTCTQCNHVFNEYRLTPAQIEAVRSIRAICKTGSKAHIVSERIRSAACLEYLKVFANILNPDKITEADAAKDENAE